MAPETFPLMRALQQDAVTALHEIGLHYIGSALAAAVDIEEIRETQHQASNALYHARMVLWRHGVVSEIVRDAQRALDELRDELVNEFDERRSA